MKSKKRIFLFAVGAIALVLGSALIVSSRAGRTRSYFAAYRASYAHAPASIRPFFALADFILIPAVEPFDPFEPVWMQVESGMKMQLNPYDLVSRRILETGEWEAESVQAVAGHLSPGATFVDVGAHIGYYSLKAASMVGPNGHVISIEPNPQTLPMLRGNIEASDARAVSVWPVACAESESTLQLYAAPRSNTGESSLSKENASQDGPATASYSVRARPLDAIVKEAKLDRVDVIKIDVEGAEFEVLKGAAQTLDDYRPVLIIEMVPNQLKAMGTSVDEVTQFLASHGYTANRHVDDLNIEFVPNKITAAVSRTTEPIATRLGSF
jgi:FkbM family methyltransferase